jgi:isocitrate/isopropylmalate dehydrogenase
LIRCRPRIRRARRGNSRAHRAVTLIPGDGVGPEVTTAALTVIEATGAVLRAGKVLTRNVGGTASTEETSNAIVRAMSRL